MAAIRIGLPVRTNYVNYEFMPTDANLCQLLLIGEPSSPVADVRESCTEMKVNGEWNSVACGWDSTRGFICEKPKIPFANLTTVSVTAPVIVTSTPTTAPSTVSVTAPVIVTSTSTTAPSTVSVTLEPGLYFLNVVSG